MKGATRRKSIADGVARGRLTVATADVDLLDTTPSSLEVKYPLLHSRNREADDLLLQEIYVNMFRHCEVQINTFAEWKQLPQQVSLFNLSAAGPEAVGGMLLAEGEFLFEELPFVRTKLKDIRCRLEFESSEGLGWMASVPRPPASYENQEPSSPGLSAPASPSPREVTTVGSFVTSRVYFQMVEYECATMAWVVQRFQLSDPVNNALYGPVFTRAFRPAGFEPQESTANPYNAFASIVMANASQSGADGSPQERKLSTVVSAMTMARRISMLSPGEVRRAKRKAVPGEERLKVSKPWLYNWCLDRNPSDLGAAATVVKESLLYFRHTFSVVRTVKTLMRSIRQLQGLWRKLAQRKKMALERMISEWSALEQATLQRLKDYQPLRGDAVDEVVNKVLISKVVTTREYKIDLIKEIYTARQEEQKVLSREQRILMGARFRFHIPPAELMAEAQSRLLEELCRDDQSPLFHDSRIVSELKIIPPEFVKRRLTVKKRTPVRVRKENVDNVAASPLQHGDAARQVIPPTPPRQPRWRDDATSSPASLQKVVSPPTLSPRPKKKLPKQPRPQYMDAIDNLFDDI